MILFLFLFLHVGFVEETANALPHLWIGLHVYISRSICTLMIDWCMDSTLSLFLSLYGHIAYTYMYHAGVVCMRVPLDLVSSSSRSGLSNAQACYLREVIKLN